MREFLIMMGDDPGIMRGRSEAFKSRGGKSTADEAVRRCALPIPFMFLYQTKEGRMQIVDGAQRMLASVLVSKFMLHQPLNRQSDTFAREGVAIDTSTLADRVGACAAALAPLVEATRRHVLAAERLYADDTTVPVLAKGKTPTGRLWTYVRDDRPFGGTDPPAAAFSYSRCR